MAMTRSAPLDTPTRPETQPAPADSLPMRSYYPTRKWMVAVVTAMGTFTVTWIQAGRLTTELQIALVGIVTQSVVTYLTPNQDTPGGVPLKKM
jgi:hypothetical protein